MVPIRQAARGLITVPCQRTLCVYHTAPKLRGASLRCGRSVSRVATVDTASTSADAVSPANEQTVQHHGESYNVLSSPITALAPFVPSVAAIAAVNAYTGILCATNPLLRTLACGIGPLLSYGIFPTLDILIGPKPHRATEHGSNSNLQLLHAICTMGLIAWAWGAVASVPLQPLQFGLLAFTLGAQATQLMGDAHDLHHSKHWFVKGMGELSSAFINYWAFCKGHDQHHVLIGTHEDNETARRGESIWAFMPRYLGGMHWTAWEASAAECARKGTSPLHNRMLLGMAAQAAITATAYTLGGTTGLVLHLALCAIMLFNFSVFEYAQHYGVVRDRGALEPVTRHLIFSTHYPVENAVVFNAGMHGHHHIAAARPYPDLETDASEPTFPAPINAWGLLALVPPLWFKLMDPLVDAAQRQHKAAVAAMA